MTSGRSLTRICLGYRHWVLCDNVFGGRVLNPPQQFMGYAVEFSLRKMRCRVLKPAAAENMVAILEIIPA